VRLDFRNIASCAVRLVIFTGYAPPVFECPKETRDHFSLQVVPPNIFSWTTPSFLHHPTQAFLFIGQEVLLFPKEDAQKSWRFFLAVLGPLRI